MSFLIDKAEADAGRRTVGFRLFGSNGTAPATGFSTGTILGSLNGAAQLSLGSASVVSANAGMYAFAFTQSNVSVLGSWDLFTDSLVVFPQHVAKVQVVNNNPMSTLSALNISALTALGVTRLDSSVTLRAVVHSGATVQGVTRVNSSVTPANAEYSAITVRIGLVDYSGATVGAGDITPRVYSGVSVEVKTGGIQAASFGANAVDAAAVATGAWQEGADRFLVRSIAGGADSSRSVGETLMAVRNRTSLSSTSYIVYQNDDTTVAWHASLVTTGDAVRITDVNPE